MLGNYLPPCLAHCRLTHFGAMVFKKCEFRILACLVLLFLFLGFKTSLAVKLALRRLRLLSLVDSIAVRGFFLGHAKRLDVFG